MAAWISQCQGHTSTGRFGSGGCVWTLLWAGNLGFRRLPWSTDSSPGILKRFDTRTVSKQDKGAPYPFVFSGPARRAQCTMTPREPDRRSPCPPHLRLLPSWLHTSTAQNRHHELPLPVCSMELGPWEKQPMRHLTMLAAPSAPHMDTCAHAKGFLWETS